MNLRPLHHRMLVRRLDAASSERVGQIVTRASAKEKPQQGVVFAIEQQSL